MSGYSMTVRPLMPEDVDVHKFDLGDHDPDMCVAVEAADLGPCLCAVIDLTRHGHNPLVWSQVPSTERPEAEEWVAITDEHFADNVAATLATLFPDILEKS
jgi:hypothetical protein